ncbi:hypothetical protein ACFSKS_07230 [Pseudocitrobacter faecalis]
MSDKAQHGQVKISVLLRKEAANAISGSRKDRLDELMKLGVTVVIGDLEKMIVQS